MSTDCIVCMEACAYKCIFYMDDGTVKEAKLPNFAPSTLIKAKRLRSPVAFLPFTGLRGGVHGIDFVVFMIIVIFASQ